MNPPNIFPTQIALKPEARVGRRRGGLIGDVVALVLFGMFLAVDGMFLMGSQLRRGFRARDPEREREILALRQRVARERSLSATAPHPQRAAGRRNHPSRTCDCTS